MKYILKTMKYLGYFLAFIIGTLVLIRMTLDLNEIKPSIEKRLSESLGLKVFIDQLALEGVVGLHLDRAKFKVPQSLANKKAWKEYRTYKKAERLAKKNGERPPEKMVKPLLPIEVCLQDVSLSAKFWDLINGEKIDSTLQAILFDCDEDALIDDTKHATLRTRILWSHKNGIFNPVLKGGSKLRLKGSLNAIDLQKLTFLKHFVPLSSSGEINSDFDVTLGLNRNFHWQKKKSNGEFSIDGTQLNTDAGDVSNFQVPKLNLGTLKANMKLVQGKLNFTEVHLQSDELKLELTGSITLARHWSHCSSASHIDLDLMPALFQRAPDFKTVASLLSKYFKKQSGGGYHAGILLRGKCNRLKPQEKKYSPYSKEGRSQARKIKSKNRNKSTRRQGGFPTNPQLNPTSPTTPSANSNSRAYPNTHKRPKFNVRDRKKNRRKPLHKRSRKKSNKNDNDDDEDSEDSDEEQLDSDRDEEDGDEEDQPSDSAEEEGGKDKNTDNSSSSDGESEGASEVDSNSTGDRENEEDPI
jgi:type II secretion system protein N